MVVSRHGGSGLGTRGPRLLVARHHLAQTRALSPFALGLRHLRPLRHHRHRTWLDGYRAWSPTMGRLQHHAHRSVGDTHAWIMAAVRHFLRGVSGVGRHRLVDLETASESRRGGTMSPAIAIAGVMLASLVI